MAAKKIEIAPERIEEGRQLYELTQTPVPDIATMMGISRRTLERRIYEWGWTPRSPLRVVADRARVAAATAPAAGAPPTRTAIAARILDAVVRELDVIDKILDKAGPASQGEAERSARTVASTTRALREMAEFVQPDEVTPPDAPDPDSIPRDIDEFREAVARRIDAFIAARRARAETGPVEPGDPGDQAV